MLKLIAENKNSIITAVVVTGILGVFGIFTSIAKSIYDAPHEIQRIRQESDNSMKELKALLSNTVTDQGRKLDDQRKQLTHMEQSIKNIKEALLKLVISSPLPAKDKEKMATQLVAVVDPKVTEAVSKAASGDYTAAYKDLFALHDKGNKDAGIAFYSLSDILYDKYKRHTATQNELKALKAALAKAENIQGLDFEGRYKGIDLQNAKPIYPLGSKFEMGSKVAPEQTYNPKNQNLNAK